MKRVYIYCEGYTEESFVNEMLYPFFLNINIYVKPLVCTTKRTHKSKYKGGVSDYNKIKSELVILCKQHKNEIITTMFDYYGMPGNTPQIHNDEVDIFNRIIQIEQAITEDIGRPNCFFGLMLHEFEGLLFSDPQAFQSIADGEVIAAIQKMRDAADSPEHINNSPENAPSKRLERLIPKYAKVKNGTIISKEIGIDRMIAECRHFSEWINKIKCC